MMNFLAADGLKYISLLVLGLTVVVGVLAINRKMKQAGVQQQKISDLVYSEKAHAKAANIAADDARLSDRAVDDELRAKYSRKP